MKDVDLNAEETLFLSCFLKCIMQFVLGMTRFRRGLQSSAGHTEAQITS